MPDESLLSGLDLSSIPDEPKPQLLLAGLDLSSIPDQPGTLTGEPPSVGMMLDLWNQDQIPATGAKSILASVPRPAERLHLENAPQILQDIWNQASPPPTVGPLAEHPLRLYPMGLITVDLPTAEANDTNYLGSGANSQTAVLGEQSMPRINMLNIYKQWAIGGIDTLLRVLYEASGALDIAIPHEPFQSPFSAPSDVNEETGRLMGVFQLPALIGAAADLGFFENPGMLQRVERPSDRLQPKITARHSSQRILNLKGRSMFIMPWNRRF